MRNVDALPFDLLFQKYYALSGKEYLKNEYVTKDRCQLQEYVFLATLLTGL